MTTVQAAVYNPLLNLSGLMAFSIPYASFLLVMIMSCVVPTNVCSNAAAKNNDYKSCSTIAEENFH